MVYVLKLSHSKKVLQFLTEVKGFSGDVTREIIIMTMYVCKNELYKLKSINKRISETKKTYDSGPRTAILIISEHSHENNCYGYIIKLIPSNYSIEIINDGKTVFDKNTIIMLNNINPDLINKLDMLISVMTKVYLQESEAIRETLKLIKDNYINTGILSHTDMEWMNSVYGRCKKLIIK